MKTFLCDDTPESILTGIFDAFAAPEKNGEIRLKLKKDGQLDLFEVQVHIIPSYEKAVKVMDSIRKKLGFRAYESVRGALSADSDDKAQALFSFLRHAFYHSVGDVMEELSIPAVMRVFELDRKARGEAHRLLGFIRFEELKPGVFFSRIGPVNDVLPLIADHFVSRFNDQAFLIYDELRKRSVVYSPGQSWYFREGDLTPVLSSLKKTDRYESLWKTFFDSTDILERSNPVCQRTLCPIHYRQYMTEFQRPS